MITGCLNISYLLSGLFLSSGRLVEGEMVPDVDGRPVMTDGLILGEELRDAYYSPITEIE